MRGAQACSEELGPSCRRDGPGVHRWDIQGGVSDMLFILSFISITRTSAHYTDSLAHMGCFGGGSLPWGTYFPCPTAKAPTLPCSFCTFERSSPLLCKGQAQERPPQSMRGEVKQKTFPRSCLEAETEWLWALSLLQLKVTLDRKGGHAQDSPPGIQLTFSVHSQVFRLCYCTDTSDSNL